jgi:hypothetical protein
MIPLAPGPDKRANRGTRRRPRQPQRRVVGNGRAAEDAEEPEEADVLSRALRFQRAKLGLELPLRPLGLPTFPTAPPARRRAPRTPAFLAVPTLTDKLGLNLLRLAERQELERRQRPEQPEQPGDGWSRANLNQRRTSTTAAATKATNRRAPAGAASRRRGPRQIGPPTSVSSMPRKSGRVNSNDDDDQLPRRGVVPPSAAAVLGIRPSGTPQPIPPFFSAKGNGDLARSTGQAVLGELQEVLARHGYRPNEHFDKTPPPEVTRVCFDALERLTASLSGPIQTLLRDASAALVKSAFVDDEYVKARLIPLGIVSEKMLENNAGPSIGTNSAVASDATTLTSSSSSSSDSSSPDSTPRTRRLLYTEANVLLSRALETTDAHLKAWEARASSASARRDAVRGHMEKLMRTESLVRAEVTAAMRQEGAMRVERDDMQARETKLQDELKNAKRMMRDAKVHEEKLADKHQLLANELENARDELAVAEERLRTVQMTQDSNLVPRTEVAAARAREVMLKKRLEEYKKVHAQLEARCDQEADEHDKITVALAQALAEREVLVAEHRVLERTYTPRPDWERIMDVCPELRRKVHERAFDAITEARREGGKHQKERNEGAVVQSVMAGLGGSGRLIAPMPIVGVPPSMMGLKPTAANTATFGNAAATSSVSAGLSLSAGAAAAAAAAAVSDKTDKTKKISNGGIGKKKAKAKPSPALPRAKKRGKTMGAEPKSAFRSLYNVDEEGGAGPLRPLSAESAESAGNTKMLRASAQAEATAAGGVASAALSPARTGRGTVTTATGSPTASLPATERTNPTLPIPAGTPSPFSGPLPVVADITSAAATVTATATSTTTTTTTTATTAIPLSASPNVAVPTSTLQFTQDLCDLLEENRLGQKNTMELEGVLRELGVVELKKILQDTQRHISETNRMIADLLRTNESIESSSTHKALVGGERHTVLEGQFFIGVGEHPQVPRYLRTSGRVRKRGIQKGELWNLTDRVWKARIKQRKRWGQHLREKRQKGNGGANSLFSSSPGSASGSTTSATITTSTSKRISPPEDSFAEFFYNYLFRRHKSHDLVVEWGYNIMAGLEVFMWDSHLELFLLTLTGAVTEDTFDDQLMLLADLRAFFLRMDLYECKKRQQYEPTGIVQLDDAVENLRAFFPDKKPKFFEKIADALAACVDVRIKGEQGGGKRSSPIEYEKLFATSNLGTQGDFIEEIRDQHLREVRESTLRLEVEIAKHVGGHAKREAKKKREKEKKKKKEEEGKKGKNVSEKAESAPATETEGGRHGEIMVLTLREIMATIDPNAPPHVIDGYLAHGLDIKEKDVRWDAHADPDLFLRRMKTRLYRPYRCWVPRVKIKLVHWKRALEAEQKELRSAGQAFRGPVDLA